MATRRAHPYDRSVSPVWDGAAVLQPLQRPKLVRGSEDKERRASIPQRAPALRLVNDFPRNCHAVLAKFVLIRVTEAIAAGGANLLSRPGFFPAF
jgi:hypothetical protein